MIEDLRKLIKEMQELINSDTLEKDDNVILGSNIGCLTTMINYKVYLTNDISEDLTLIKQDIENYK